MPACGHPYCSWVSPPLDVMKRQPSPKKDRMMQFPGFDSNNYLLLVIFQTFRSEFLSVLKTGKPVSERQGLLHVAVKKVSRLFKHSRRAKKGKPGHPANVSTFDDHRCRMRGIGEGPDCGCLDPLEDACLMSPERKVV
jgi:hypothetical protein